ncbi:hypothetical protein ES703_117108 [subsurface metagenome]
MRVCPECGYTDPPCWRQVPWKFDTDFARTDDFKRLHPEVYRKLEIGHKIVCDEHFAYRFSGKAKIVVWRVWKKAYECGGKSAFNIPMERALHKLDQFQRKLPMEDKSKNV